MTFTFTGLIAFTADVREAAKLYEEAFGLARDWEDDHHVQFHLPTKGNAEGAWLLLHPATEESHGQYLGYFAVDDVDAVAARAQSAGFTITQQPSDAPWGVREANLTDPDGNALTLNGPIARVS
ncbi:hypothetical protein GCM10011575_25970 [Microlunatus endophyticus]|uniref:VOC domain-containing protein n=1 Tax=Microlunatus endophyticus TaxID=1716077 RepID=A0A917SBD6_9ACTN|nr:VOC family protein [Microlunatus endophyticus]GGL66253.1 hypothetical protein GCM10011575_25970 [Microlunatus endophyticus]